MEHLATGNKMADVSAIDDYSDIERHLQKAQMEIGEALTHISSKDVAETADYRTALCMDFLSIFNRGDLQYDVTNDDVTASDDALNGDKPRSDACVVSADGSSLLSSSPWSAAGVIDPHGFTTTLVISRRPDPVRPSTLSRPVQLPACCNFRKQPWRVYVHGDFSYRSTPRFYEGVDGEIGSAKDNEDLVRIIDELSRNDMDGGKNKSVSDRTDVTNRLRPSYSSTENTSSSAVQSTLIDDCCSESTDDCNNSYHHGDCRQRLTGNDCVGVAKQRPTVGVGVGSRPDAVVSMSCCLTTSDDINCVQPLNLEGCPKVGDDNSSSVKIQQQQLSHDVVVDSEKSSVINQSTIVADISKSDSVCSTTSGECNSPSRSPPSEMILGRDRVESPRAGRFRRQLKSRPSRNRSLQRADVTAETERPHRIRNGKTNLSRRSRTLSPAEHSDDYVTRTSEKNTNSDLTHTIASSGWRSALLEKAVGSGQCAAYSHVTAMDHVVSSPPIRRHRQPMTCTTSSRAGNHVTSSLPAIDENELQTSTTVAAKLYGTSGPRNANNVGFWLDVNDAGQVVAKRATTSSKDERRESLLDSMHKKYYPTQYQQNGDTACCHGKIKTRSAEQLATRDVVSSLANRGLVASLDRSNVRVLTGNSKNCDRQVSETAAHVQPLARVCSDVTELELPLEVKIPEPSTGLSR